MLGSSTRPLDSEQRSLSAQPWSAKRLVSQTPLSGSLHQPRATQAKSEAVNEYAHTDRNQWES